MTGENAKMNVWYKQGTILQDEIRQTDLPDFLLAVWYIGQMGAVVKWRDTVISFDPVLNDLKNEDGLSRRHYEPPFAPETWMEPDYVIGTHWHADHINLQTLLPMAKNNLQVKFIAPEPEKKKLICGGVTEKRVTGARAGESLQLAKDIFLHPVAASHETYETDSDGNYCNLGYVLECGKIKFYHAGDTIVTEKLIEDVKAFGKIDIACLPINGNDFERRQRKIIGNMDCHDAAFFANQIGADITIPMHYDMVVGNEADPLNFLNYMQEKYPGKKTHIMCLGERMIYG